MIQGLYRIHDTGVIQDACYRGYTGYMIQGLYRIHVTARLYRIHDTGVIQDT